MTGCGRDGAAAGAADGGDVGVGEGVAATAVGSTLCRPFDLT